MKQGSYRLRYVSRALRWLPPEMPGKARLARRMLGLSLKTQDEIVIGRDGIRYVIPSLREPVGFYLLIDGVYEVKSLNFVLNRLQPGAVFLDIGANIGTFTLPAARKVGPSGCVVAVEPSPRVFPYLKHNVTLNKFTNVRLIQSAVFNQNCQNTPFYEAPVEKFGMGSLGAQFQEPPESVTCQTVDSILDEQHIGRVDVIKVDVEGFESTVFEGAEKLLTGDHPPVIVFEFCDWAEKRFPRGKPGQAQEFLMDLGYRIWLLRDYSFGGRPLEAPLTSGSAMLVAERANSAF